MRDYLYRLEDYGITRERMRELIWICRQYAECRQKAAAIRRGEPVDAPGRHKNSGWKPKDPTGDMAIRSADNRWARRVEQIEAAAKAADRSIWKYILKNACDGVPFTRMAVPCSKQYFDRARRLFYVELDRRV